ncbi:MAG: arylsulfatase [Verrucomicrobia bacterium]|nr:MAG: arylsulfatase [Verrucomicrobiota bacterium]
MTISQLFKARLGHLLVTLLLALGWTLRGAERRPNFLFIYTDDQRWDALGVVQREQGERGRFPWFKTPAMDRLASEGVRFRHAFVTLSLCAPSRTAFLTGRYNHLNGVCNNHTPFPANNVTYATLLRAAGYTTGYIGKWHMDGQRGQRPGFDYSASFIGQGRYWDCPFEINGQAQATTGWVDDVATDFATEFLKRNTNKPFALIIGYKAPHGPCDPPERAKDRFEGERARPVPSLGVTAIYREAVTNETKAGAAPGTNDQGSTVRVNLNYFRCISAADDNLDRVLKTLDTLGLAESTVVVFCSDNGFYMGEHRLGDKRSVYDDSLLIPMIVRYPKLFPKGKALDQMVLNIDIAPTFLELAGVSVPSSMQGRSWVPLLTGRSSDWRKAFFCEYFREQGYPGTPTVVGIRTDTAKLIKYPGHETWTELFDLVADPYEIKNLAHDPKQKSLLKTMLTEFARQEKAVDFRVPDYADEVRIPGLENEEPKAGKKGKKRQ